MPERVLRRIQRFILRASFVGTLHWICPYCGNKNRSRMWLLRWTVKCGGSYASAGVGSSDDETDRVLRSDRPSEACQASFIPQLNLIPVPPGRTSMPRDWIVPDGLRDAFPAGELITTPKWRSGGEVHRLLDRDQHPAFCCLHNLTGGKCDEMQQD